jgi:hypothetical protein
MGARTFHTPRRWDRDPVSMPVRLVLSSERFRSDNSAITVDVSLRGMKVRTTLADLIPGEWIGIVPKAGFPQAIPARVIWSKEDEVTRWIYAGLEFLQTNES